MSTEIAVPDSAVDLPMMTASEARDATEAMKECQDSFWLFFIDIHDRKGWKALGYESFESYVQAEHDISPRYYYRKLTSLHIERSIGLPFGTMPETQARVIGTLPEALQPAAYQAAEGKNYGDPPKQRHVKQAVDEIKGKLPPDEKKPKKPRKKPAEPVADITIDLPAGEDPSVTLLRPESDIPDAEWVEERTNQKVRAALTGRLLACHDNQAILYRMARPHKNELAALLKSQEVANGGDPVGGPYQMALKAFLSVPHPIDWLICGQCKGSGQNCRSCRGNGYVVRS